MTLADLLGINFRYREALILGALVAFFAAIVIIPRAISKLRRAGIVGRDRHKPGAPEIPEMGGLGVFLAFNIGAFSLLAVGHLESHVQILALASLVVCAGACITGILDDLISLRQRFKAIIPLAFAAPLALYVQDTAVTFPVLGTIGFGWTYPVLLVPLGITFASNAFNMLEGFNGLGTGLGIILASALGFMAMLSGNLDGLAILVPMVGALAGMMVFNGYPAKVFPGDTMTLLVGAALACGAIMSGLEFWVALLFVPHLVEFALKARASFKVQSFAARIDEAGGMHHEGPVRSLTHVPMRLSPGITEPKLVFCILGGHAAYVLLVMGLFWLQLR
jgi:UDP-N-acetylglucosamine--dolichyl-phosphate N-acetylglucosaminephosphotransferase